MQRIEYISAFRRDFKCEKKGQYRRDLDSLVAGVVSLLKITLFPRKIATTVYWGNGPIIVNVI